MNRSPLHRFAVLATTASLATASLSAPAAAAPATTAAPANCTGYVGLTFDDGPAAGNTTALLNALTAAGARATMFNTGQNVQANPDLARAQLAAGMWIGNHSWDHPHMTPLTTAEQTSQISRTQDVIRQVTGVTPQLFRPPYLETDDALRTVQRQFGLTEINADVDSRDWDNVSADQIVAAAAGLRAGDVILMHDWPPNTVQAVPRIVAGLTARGLCTGKISPTTGRAIAPDDPGPGTGTTCAAAYRTTGNWTGGFQGEVTVTNTGTTAVDHWKVTLTLPGGAAIGSLWNGVNTGTTGAVTVTDAGYNGALGAGRSTTFGFVGTGNPAGTTVACGTGTGMPPATALDGVHTVARLDDRGATARYTWPGTYFEGRFQGTGIGIVLDDAVNDYDIQIDAGAPVTVVQPGRTTHWINGLTAGDHTVRLAKRTESPWSAGQFGGFVAATGGRLLGKPAARARQIEFIGDSWTAGYGNMSAVRDCTATGGIDRNTNADRSFGALAARTLNADYQINAWSGRGMVRNYNGSDPATDYRTYYDRTLQAIDTSLWQRPASWKPQVVVIGLGINDFSTALNAGERWATTDALAADFRTAYQGFIDKLRSRYGTGTHLVLTYPDINPALTASIEQIVQQRTTAGDTAVHALNYGNALGLDLLGCDWHPSTRDHGILATAVTSFVGRLPLNW